MDSPSSFLFPETKLLRTPFDHRRPPLPDRKKLTFGGRKYIKARQMPIGGFAPAQKLVKMRVSSLENLDGDEFTRL